MFFSLFFFLLFISQSSIFISFTPYRVASRQIVISSVCSGFCVLPGRASVNTWFTFRSSDVMNIKFIGQFDFVQNCLCAIQFLLDFFSIHAVSFSSTAIIYRCIQKNLYYSFRFRRIQCMLSSFGIQIHSNWITLMFVLAGYTFQNCLDYSILWYSSWLVISTNGLSAQSKWKITENSIHLAIASSK